MEFESKSNIPTLLPPGIKNKKPLFIHISVYNSLDEEEKKEFVDTVCNNKKQ